MRNKSFEAALIGIAICLQLITVKTFGQNTAIKDSVYISAFNGGRSAAVCYSFDDGIKDQYVLAYPMLLKFNFPATFFVIPSQVPQSGESKTRINQAQLKEMADHGMEISNHSWTHSKNLTTLDSHQLHEEIEKADSAIYRMIGKRPVTFAYPWNAFNATTQAEVLKEHIASREFQFGIGTRFTTEAGNKWTDDLIKKKSWGIAMIHAISAGFDTLKSPAELENHLAYVKQRESEIWVTTFEALTKYRLEHEATKLEVSLKKGKATIRMTNTLSATIFNEPLTVVLQTPKPVIIAEAYQHGKKLPVRIEQNRILVNALPDGEAIKCSWR